VIPRRIPRERVLDPLAALAAAVDRASVELAGRSEALDSARRERLEHAAGDVLRALVWARHEMRDLERASIAALDDIAHALGTARLGALGISGRMAG